MQCDPPEDQVYVAELQVPSHFYVKREVRGVLPNCGSFEVSEG